MPTATDLSSTDVRFPSHDGRRMRAQLAIPEGPGPHPGILVIHESFGLNDDIRRICKRFADGGYAALAPDLFDRRGARALCVARAFWDLKTRSGQAFDDLDAARDFFVANERVDDERLGVAGFCLGGGFALLLGVQEPFNAAAPFYGDVPKDMKMLEGTCPVIASFGGRDRVFGPKAERLRRHLEQLGVEHDVKVYPEAGHSFMSRHEPTLMVRLASEGPMKVGYHEASAEDAWRRMLAFFDKHLAAS